MHQDKKLYGTATVGTKGQVVIPADARKSLGINEGDRLYVVGSSQGKYVGFIKEEQLREVVSKLVENVESYQEFLNEEKEK